MLISSTKYSGACSSLAICRVDFVVGTQERGQFFPSRIKLCDLCGTCRCFCLSATPSRKSKATPSNSMCDDQNLARPKRNREDCLMFDPRSVNLGAQLIEQVCSGPNVLYHLLFYDQSPPSSGTSINTTRGSTSIFVLACCSTTKVMELEPRSKVVGYVATAESRHVDGHVAEKYRGSAADRREMEMMGKQQVLRVSAFISCCYAMDANI